MGAHGAVLIPAGLGTSSRLTLSSNRFGDAVVPNEGRRCSGVGPNYWRTFDGLEFLFAGRCVYTLFSDGTCTVTVDMSRCSAFAKCRKVNTGRPRK